MADQKRKTLRWVRLDNAAKIYPAARRRNWSSTYRLAVTLHEDVDCEVLKRALDVLVHRFPSIAARLRKGVFWYYLQQVSAAPEIREEYSYPLVHMDKEEMRRCAFRVIVHHERIALEFFHALTDGHGSMVFMKNLVAEYLTQKYGISIPYTHGIVDRNEPPREEELEDSFLKYAGPVAASRKDTNAWRMTGTREEDGFLHLTCFQIPVRDALAAAHRYNTTLTVFMSAVMMQALVQLQEEQTPPGRRKQRIKLMLPINLRTLFPSNTLRNFSMYTTPELDPRLGSYTFEEICKIIQYKMGLEFTAKHMSKVIATNVNDERNPLVRLIPLPIKNMVMKMIFDRVGEKKSCLSVSNLGQIKVPEEMAAYIRRIDAILGAQADAPYNCVIMSYGDTMHVNFTRNIREPDLERHFFAVLQQMGLQAMVESNLNER